MEKNTSQEKVIDDLYLLLRTIYHYERNIAAQFGLDYQEIYLLQILRRESSQRLTEIARVLDIPMFSASRLVDRLVEKKLVEKVQGKPDRRSISLSLLPEGEAIVHAVEASSYEKVMAGTQDMSQTDFNMLLNTVEKLHKILGISKFINQ